MKKHMIALDLDGTLLTDDKIISERTKQVLFRAKEEGHILVISTGRPHRASINYYHELGLDTPMVNFNGALIHHPQNRNWDALHTPMPIRTAHKIIDACYDLRVNNILAEVLDDVYIDSFDSKLIGFFDEIEDEAPFVIGNLKQKLEEDPTSILVYPEEEQVQQLRSHLDNYHAEVIEHRKWGAPWNVIEIIKKGMNKAVGLHKIAHYFDIPEDRIIAFGDEDNDLEMIDYAGVGVAMGNAIDELKSIAKHVTATNEEDGIGSFLEEYLKLKVNTPS
ncbi:Cof-type HAD-IIB family hydrolase [Oceanobacillus alkalisoli]|uniref:Cof-type HAD-IIB family hydrolase n=1 Tax=Oceanobacillus alkalisoli TaxID=2925113 RepID=UPI001EF087D0|nr:Cof-type HAD-IIB family hydrolase [Oceanobacillus alkalisoli]MCF3942061.1 Cof-type HAD-IIB family hydrolase [Oceanobacillus alkalisoli]MCG5101986.1 Cof-type HAD-IIB family hydrolase [Oceanobacillus alkalisoli]